MESFLRYCLGGLYMEGVIFGILRYACITCQRPHNFQFTQYQSESSKKNKNFIWNEKWNELILE